MREDRQKHKAAKPARPADPDSTLVRDDPPDPVLLARAACGDDQAVDQLLARYKHLVRRKASMMYMAGADAEDVIQEGMIGLFKAIRVYRPERNVPFPAFASYCVMSQITDAVRQASRKKHQMLSHSISLQSLVHPEQDDPSARLIDRLAASAVFNPEQALLNQEDLSNLMAFIQQKLSGLERNVVLLFIQNLSYQQIAACLDASEKTVDNALSRARKKFLLYRQQAQSAPGPERRRET